MNNLAGKVLNHRQNADSILCIEGKEADTERPDTNIEKTIGDESAKIDAVYVSFPELAFSLIERHFIPTFIKQISTIPVASTCGRPNV